MAAFSHLGLSGDFQVSHTRRPPVTSGRSCNCNPVRPRMADSYILFQFNDTVPYRRWLLSPSSYSKAWDWQC